MPEPISVTSETPQIPLNIPTLTPTPSCHKGTPRRCRINYKYKYRRASCPLAFEQPLPGKLYRSRSEIMEDGCSISSTSGSGSVGGGRGSSTASCSAVEDVLLRIHVPELKVEKCMQFHKEDIVWDVKQQALANLPKELKESFNYGLFYPPQNGRAGKFLDEERPLADYPFSSPVGYLELKYKRRVYKMLRLEEKSLRALHTKANLRRFMEFIKDNNTEKVSKMCLKGLDPNFHCQESGETPLTISATRLKKCSKMIMFLVNGGALLDYRTRDGLTPMHKAVQADNYEGVKTLLDLGASPNYRDTRGLTPLYYTVTHATDPSLCEVLLHDYSVIGACDNQGWQETHQACRNKLVHHLEHLLFYGADMNAQNASGNTPLHVCAVNNLEQCARVLLFRGCDKSALNFANQTPYQVAVIAGNMELAQIIQNHTSVNIVPFREPPKFNPKRRISGVPLSRTHSDPRLEGALGTKPPSPSPSNRSIPPFSSASSLSEASTGSGSTCTHPSEPDSESGVSGAGSSKVHHMHQHRANEQNSDIVSDSSGVCTSNSCSNESYDSTIAANSNASTLTLPDVGDFNVGMLVVCLKPYNPHSIGHLDVNPGEIIEVTGSTDDGYLEGCFKGRIGLFPPQCVQEIRLRNPKAVRDNLIGRIQNRNVSSASSNSVNSHCHQQLPQDNYGTTPRVRKISCEPRTVVLQRGKKGFGFILRGAKATSPLIDRPYERGPALQYLDDVDPGGVADEAGLRKGDYILKINDEDVSQTSHEHVVNLIKKAGDIVKMTIQPPASVVQTRGTQQYTPHYQTPFFSLSGTSKRGCQTLPRRLSNVVYAPTGRGMTQPPAPPPRDPKTTLSVGRARARSMVAGLQDFEALDCMRSSKEPVIMTQSAYYMSQCTNDDDLSSGKCTPNGVGGDYNNHSSNGMTNLASINPRAIAKRLSVTSLEQEVANRSSPTGKLPKVYASVAEMKKARALKAQLAAESTRLHKDFHSTPDLQGQVMPVVLTQLSSGEKRMSLSQEQLQRSSAQNAHLNTADHHTLNLYERRTMIHDHDYQCSDQMRLRRSVSAVNANQLAKAGVHPPPSHPPPPVPIGQVVKVDLSRAKGDYATIGRTKDNDERQTRFCTPTSEDGPTSPSVMSSFKPSNSGKLYASPTDLNGLPTSHTGSGNLNNSDNRSHSRSHSLPPVDRAGHGDPRVHFKETCDSSDIYSSNTSTLRRKANNASGEEKVSYSQEERTCCNGNGTVNSYVQEPGHDDRSSGQKKISNGKPSIPDPDYSSDEDTYSLQEELKKRPLKKKKHTVMFAPNLVSSSSDPPNEVKQLPECNPLASSNFADLIAKKAAERKARQENGGGSAPASTTSSPIKKLNGGKNKEPLCLTDAIKGSNLFNRQRQKAMEGSCVSSTESKDDSSTNGMTPISKVGSPKHVAPRQNLTKPQPNVMPCLNDPNLEDGDNSSSGVSSDQEHIQHDSPNYVTVINTETNSVREQKGDRFSHKIARDDSSEASESSDEASDRTWILTNDRADRSDSGKDSDSSTGSRKSGTLTKNAVSLVKLPPPQESNERDIDPDIHLRTSGMITKTLDQDSISTVSSLSSLSSASGSGIEKPDHFTPPSTNNRYNKKSLIGYTNSNTQDFQRTSASREIRSVVQNQYNLSQVPCTKDCVIKRSADAESVSNYRDRSSTAVENRSATLDRNFFNSHKNSSHSNRDSTQNKYERSIEDSLQLIRMHMDSLNEVNSLAGIKSARPPASSDMVLAPPPEFCDTSLHPNKNKKPGRTVIHITSDGSENELPVQIFKKPLTASASAPHPERKKSFRNKLLGEWTTKDTTDWLESLFMPEYKESFSSRQIDGSKLLELNNERLISLGIRKIGHRVKIEKSLKKYKPVDRIDL